MGLRYVLRHGGVTRDPPVIIALYRSRLGSVTRDVSHISRRGQLTDMYKQRLERLTWVGDGIKGFWHGTVGCPK
jgi:hypothetical protein